MSEVIRMDQCKHCIVRGDIAACEQTDCDKHEYWYTKTLRARVARLEEALRFVLDECDWEESANEGGGDNRIGPVIRRALEGEICSPSN